MRKRILSLILVISIISSFMVSLPVVANAETIASGTCGSNLTWALDDSGTLTISGQGAMYNWDFGNSAPWYYSYSIRANIVNVVIENTVTSIGKHAFLYCTNLTNISIPNSVTSIGDNAFFSCDSLTNISIPNSVTSIGDNAFSYCTSLTSISIPNGVTSIGDNAFSFCDSLTSINVSDGNLYYSSIDGNLYNKNKTELIRYAIGKSNNSFNIPNSVTSIGRWAFSNCTSLTSISIPNSVTSIGHYAFLYCTNLTNISIPNSVTSIGYNAFSNCTSLTSISIPNSVTSIAHYAFSDCTSLTSISIPSSVTSISGQAFSSCTNLTNISIPNSVTSIGDNAFSYCTSLTSISIPNSVTSIGDFAFSFCDSLTSINASDGNLYYSSIDGNLYNKNKTVLIQYAIGKSNNSFNIPNSVTSISDYAFSNCTSLTNISIPNSVTSIGDNAFSSCTSLTSISIPNSVTSIGRWAFYDCYRLTDVYYSRSEDDWAKISIGSANSYLTNATIHYNYNSIPKDNISNSTSNNAPVIKSAKLQYGGKTYDIINQSVDIEKSSTDKGNITVDIEWKGTVPANKKVYLTQGASTNNNDNAFIQFNNLNNTFEYVPLASVFEANKPIYIIAVDESDVKNKSSSVMTKINIIDLSADDVFNRAKDEESKSLKLGEDIEFTIPEDVPVFGGMELSWKLNFIPITTEIQDNRIKVAIGLDVKDDGEFIFENLQTDIKDFVGKCKDRYNDNLSEYLEDLGKAKRKQDRSLRQLRNDLRMSAANRQKNKGLTMSMWGNKVIKGSVSDDFDAGIDCLGYLIADRDKRTGEWIFSEGYICFEASVSDTHTGQIFVHMIPCYYTIGGDFTAALSGTVKDMDFRNFHPKFQAEIMAKFGATVGAGVGVPAVAGFDMTGNGNLNVKFGINTFEENLKDYMKVFIGANAKFKLTLLGQVVAEKKVWELDENKGIIYSTYPEDADKSWIKPNSASLMSLNNIYNAYSANNVYENESREYLESSMEWYGDMPPISLFAADYTNKNLTVLADSVYPQAQPQIFSINGKKVLVFTADNDTRNANNKQMLVYSVYNDEEGTWSETVPVYDDGTADFYPSVSGENLVWQNQKSVMGDGLSLAEIGKQGEIVIAKWNGNGFDAPVSLTDNDSLDTLPKVAVNNNEISVVWLKNSADDILGIDGDTSIVKKVYNGSAWGEEVILKDNLNVVTDLSVGYSESVLNVAYVHDVDDDITTINDREVYLIGTSEKQVTDNEVLDSNAIINSGKLYWYSENNVHFMNLTDSSVSTVFEDARYTLADGFTVSEDNGNIAILWSGSEDNSSEIKGVLYQDGAWGDVITVSELGAYAKYPTCVLEEDGTILTSFTAEADGITSLYTLGLFPSYDLAISDIYFDEKNLALNSENEFEVMVTNSGELPVDGYTINVYSEDESLNNSILFEDTIKAGESKAVVGKFITGDTISYETLKIEIVINADEEYVYDNNSVTLSIGNGDISIENVAVYEMLPTSCAIVNVANIGYSDIDNVTVNLRADSEDGDVIFTKNIGVLESEQSIDVRFEYNPQDYENVKWYVTVETEADEVSVGNNYDYFINECAVGLEDYEISILNYSYADKQLTVNAFAKNNTNDILVADAVFAVYSNDGRLKGITTQPLNVGVYSDTGIDVWFENYNYANGDFVKMFVWRRLNNIKPMVEAKQVTLIIN